MWIGLLGLHLVGLVGFNLVLRKSVLRKIDKFSLATVMQTGIAVPAIFLLAFFPPDFQVFSGLSFVYLLLVVIFTIALQVTNVQALEYLEAGVYAILYNLRIILTTALGVLFLNEDIVWLRIAGGALIFLAIIIIKQKSSKSARIQGVFWGLAAATILSVLNMFEKLLVLDIGFINYFPLAAVVCGVLMWSYLIFRNKKIDKNILKQPNMGWLMLLRACSAYGFSGALGAGALISVGNYVSGTGVIFTVLFGAWLLNERDYLKRKIAAAMVALAGLTLIFISSLV